MASKGIVDIVKLAAKDFGDDDCPRQAASLAYSTVFSLPPLLILLILVAGLVWDPAAVERALQQQFGTLIGSAGAQQVQQIIQHAKRPGSGGPFPTILSVGALILGATGAFLELQNALNRAWDVKPDPKSGGVKNFVAKRLLSLGMVLGIGFLLAVSLALTAAVSALGQVMGGMIPEVALHVINNVLTLAIIAFLFAAMFKVLPDAKIAWRDVWAGAIATALFFTVGKFLIGFYLGRSDPGTAYGAAGALAVVLVWIYYAGMILFFGAEFTHRWAVERGAGARPEPGAVKVEVVEQEVRGGATANETRAQSTHSQSGDGRRVAAVANSTDSPSTQSVQRGRSSMAMEQEVPIRSDTGPSSTTSVTTRGEEPSLADLLKKLSIDTGELIREELALAKAELRETGATLARDGAKIGLAVGLGLAGVLALTAFLISGLGALLGDRYWLGALIVAVVYFVVGALLANGALGDIRRRSLVPAQTVETLRDDVAWAKHEAREVERELTT